MRRHKHNLSHWRLTTMNQAQLFPVGCVEVLPGDSFRHQVSALVRVSPLVAPVMHPVHIHVHSWFVPSRILWNSFEDFITRKDDTLTVPTTEIADTENAQALARAFGVGMGSNTITVNALPFRAYNKIWNEFYRDQDLSSALTEATGDGPDLSSLYQIKDVSWEKDYFTTARSEPQQGTDAETVSIDIGEMPVTGIGKSNQTYGAASQAVYETDGSGTTTYTDSALSRTSDFYVEEDPNNAGFPNIRADGTSATATFDINEWRTAMALQRLREHRNRFGSRYTDYLAFLGIRGSDQRLQRPEYLGGGKQTVAFSEVLQTSESGTTPLGEMGGHGIAAVRTRPYKRFFEEHGYVLTLMFARPKTMYMDGIPRMFSRQTFDDFWQKELEIQGDQAILNKEVYSDHTTPDGTFGFARRHDDYRFHQSNVSGEFRNTLDFWHMARIFTSDPALNETFVTSDPTNRIYQATSEDQLYVMANHKLAARRLVSKIARN